MNPISKPILFASLFFLVANCFAQTSTTERFGQNRVQYKDFTFSYYESDNFNTYFYQGGQDVAKFVIKAAEDDAEDISKLLDYRYKKKIDIIVYNTIGELNQTNIGIYDPNPTPGGAIKIPDGKIFVYFNGDHDNLEKQVREGIARVYIDKMVAGSGFGEVIQNAVLLNLPDWYRLGLSQYIGENWNSDMEDRLRDGIISGRYKTLNKLSAEEAIFVGHSIWHYIEETKGKTALSNVVYLTRLNRSVDNGFLFVLGTNLSQTLEMWFMYYHDRFMNETRATSLPPEKTIVKTKVRKGLQYYQSRLSADGKHIAYASNDMGRYKVHLVNLDEPKKRNVILKGGFRTNTIFTDNSIPLMAWDPTGKKLTIIRERRGKTFMITYDIEKHKKEIAPIRKFQKVLSFSYMNSKQLVMSAMQNGQTDIFIYNIASTTTRKITDDYFDDLDPAYITVDSMQGIMFSSNREDEVLTPQRYESQVMNKQYDLFFYNLDGSENRLYRVTSTPYANESYPQNLNDSAFTFLSEKNGIRNRYVGHFEKVFDYNRKTYRFVIKESGDEDSVQVRQSVPLDSAIDKNTVELKDSSIEKVYKINGVSAPVTDYEHNILEQSVVGSKNLALDLFRIKNRAQFRVYSLDSITPLPALPPTDYMVKLQSKPTDEANAEKKKETGIKNSAAVTDSLNKLKNRPFDFQSEFDYGIKLFDWDSASASRLNAIQSGYVFRFSKVRPYFVRFSVDKVIAQVDDNPIVTRYQLFDPSSPQYNAEPLSFSFKVGVTDLLEDYKIYGGIRFPFSSLNSSGEYFLTYENLKKRLDKKITFYRKSILNTTDGTLPFTGLPLPDDLISEDYSIKTNYLEVALSYPLDVLNSFRFIFGLRSDKVVFKSEDSVSLNIPNQVQNWLSARSEYVFDNCLDVMTNIRYGTRVKFYAEVQKQVPTKSATLFNQLDIPLPTMNNKFFTVFGFDARHYLKIYRQIIWANRVSGAASFGTDKLLFLMGGLDSWIGSTFDNSTPINTNNGYAYETLATPLRGFDQNARNGDKFVLFNSELRIPLFTVLSNTPLKNELLRNFEIIGFFDAGTAWEGLSPFSNNNPLFNQVIPNNSYDPSVLILLKQYQNPILMGFGPGLRTSLLGFFLKLDAAWGYNTGQVGKPIYYFSFGLDF